MKLENGGPVSSTTRCPSGPDVILFVAVLERAPSAMRAHG